MCSMESSLCWWKAAPNTHQILSVSQWSKSQCPDLWPHSCMHVEMQPSTMQISHLTVGFGSIHGTEVWLFSTFLLLFLYPGKTRAAEHELAFQVSSSSVLTVPPASLTTESQFCFDFLRTISCFPFQWFLWDGSAPLQVMWHTSGSCFSSLFPSLTWRQNNPRPGKRVTCLMTDLKTAYLCLGCPRNIMTWVYDFPGNQKIKKSSQFLLEMRELCWGCLSQSRRPYCRYRRAGDRALPGKQWLPLLLQEIPPTSPSHFSTMHKTRLDEAGFPLTQSVCWLMPHAVWYHRIITVGKDH